MTFTENLVFLLVLVLVRNDFGVCGSDVSVKKENETLIAGPGFFKSFNEFEEKNLEQEIFQELNHLSARQQREIFSDLENQSKKLNATQRSLLLAEPDNLSPLNVEELKNIKKTLKASNNNTLPAIRNKRTLNFLLSMVARAMGYTLTPSNPNAEWIPRLRPQPSNPPPCSTTPPPCSTTPPPCSPSPPPCPTTPPPCSTPPPPCPTTPPPCSTPPPPCPTTPPPCSTPPPPCPTTPPPCGAAPPSPSPPPCAMPPPSPPCKGMTAMQSAIQLVTVPPNQINPNTISYPLRQTRTIPLFNFAPLPQGVRVPYPPLLQALTQRSPCAPPQPTQPPCATPAPSPPPCGTTPAPSPPPCSTPASPPCAPKTPPCAAPRAPSPPPCATPAPSPSPCATTPAPRPPPCSTPAPSPPPCSPKPPPCAPPTPSPPCATTPAPRPPPCTPAPAPPPCSTPAPPPPPPPQQPPKKGSILLEYDDPVRIQIFSNKQKFLPASGNIFKGHDDGEEELTHSYFFPSHGETKKNHEDVEEEEQEEHVEAEEEDDSGYGNPQKVNENLKFYEEEDERQQSNKEEEEDESETNLSIVKKPLDQEMQKKKRRLVSSKKTNPKDEKENGLTEEKSLKMKKPKRKKWVRIVKKQRRKTKTDSNPQENYQIYSSDIDTDNSFASQKVFGRSVPHYNFYKTPRFEDSAGDGSHNLTQIELKKVVINNEEIKPEVVRDIRRYDYDPYRENAEDEKRKKLEKAVEKYVEEYVEKQLGAELIKNTGIPRTTVFEFSPKNGPKIQTITTTVAKTTRNGSPSSPTSLRPQFRPEPERHYSGATFGGENGNARFVKKNSYEENNKRKGSIGYEAFATRS